MRSVQEALDEILKAFSVLPSEQVSLAEAFGRTLAGAVTAVDDLPPFSNTAMDGYAVRAADVTQVPVRLKVIGDIPAGSFPSFAIGEGQAARIMTGAPIPVGADAIVPIEETNDDGGGIPDWVEIRKSSPRGAYIRQRGEDVRAGEQCFAAGHVLRPQDVGLLAGLGIAQVEVVRRPKVALFSTGDELLLPDQPLAVGKIRDMNRYSLGAMVRALGGEVLDLGIAGDTPAAVRGILLRAVEAGADLILSSAGVSVGAYDVVKQVMGEVGTLEFWKVAMRPGKPLAFGRVRGIPYFGLPGNPVSSLVSFEVFVRPALLKMMGQPSAVPTYEVRVGEDMTSDGRESYIRVTLSRHEGGLVAYSTGTQSSGALSSLVKADGLLIIPSGVQQVSAGDVLKVRPFAGQPLWK